MGHATMENRHGLAVAGMVTHADGTAERRASEIMLKARSKAAGRRITVGEDKAYDTADHVANLRAIKVTPHVTQNNGLTKTGKIRKSAIDQRTNAASRLWHVAITPGDDRVHLRLGQATWHHAQDQTSWHRSCRR